MELFVYYLFPVWPDAANAVRQIGVQRNGEHYFCRIGFPLLRVLIALDNTWNYFAGGPRLVEPLFIELNRIGVGCDSGVYGGIFPIFNFSLFKGVTPGFAAFHSF